MSLSSSTSRGNAVTAAIGAVTSAADVMAREDAHTSGLYPKRPLVLARGRGALVWDLEGNEYVDCMGAHGAANVGHAHPAIVEAVSRQVATLGLCPESLYHPLRAELLERLTALGPGGPQRAFLCSSGTEANEAALKFARLTSGRSGVVACMRGFHGRTMGALSATWEKSYREPFAPLVPGFEHVPYGDLDALGRAVSDATAAVILEVVQGEGGVRPGSPEYLRGVQALCRERGALLIVDEVQTGFGRTGAMFACQHAGLEPDLLTLAKSLAGGVPMGAVLIGQRVGKLTPLSHGTTFGGNPLACAAALATLDVIEREGLVARARDLGAHAQERLRAIDAPVVREVRGLGLLLGVELKLKVTPILQALMRRGVLALPAGPTVLRLLPPLVIEQAQLDRALDAVEAVLREQGGESPPA